MLRMRAMRADLVARSTFPAVIEFSACGGSEVKSGIYIGLSLWGNKTIYYYPISVLSMLPLMFSTF